MDFTPLGGGYGRTNYTPYMHIVCDHLPNILRTLANNDLRVFSGEATESLCRLARNTFRHASHRNNAQSVMVKQFSLNELESLLRIKRPYSKRKSTAPARNSRFGVSEVVFLRTPQAAAAEAAAAAAAAAVPMEV